MPVLEKVLSRFRRTPKPAPSVQAAPLALPPAPQPILYDKDGVPRLNAELLEERKADYAAMQAVAAATYKQHHENAAIAVELCMEEEELNSRSARARKRNCRLSGRLEY